MRISKAKWASLLLLASFLTALAPAANGLAQTRSVEAISSTAQTDFPNEITFDLEATVDGTLTSVDLVYEMAALETMQLLSGEFEQDASVVRATAVSDLEVSFLPVGIDIAFRWLLTFEDGETAETTESTITWIDDRFDWEMRSAEGVEVYGYETSDDFLQLITDVASLAILELSTKYQPATTLPIRIWIYETGEDYAGTKASNSEEWAAGSAYPDLQLIHAVVPDGSESEVFRIIPHEVSHQIFHMATMNPYNAPATWIDEGLAVIAQQGSHDLYDDVVESAFEDDELVSMQGLISAFPFNPSEVRLAYAQSYSMMSFIVETWGEEKILAIVQAYAAGNSHDDVLMEALGVDLSELESLWLDWLGGKYGLVAA